MAHILSEIAIEKLTHRKYIDVRIKAAKLMDLSVYTFMQKVRFNEPDSDLTKLSVIELLEKEFKVDRSKLIQAV